ncbi:MAG: tyrosine-type recombinase/integrase [Eggerthellaceae bacterium]|nr:tyrosine-type recombinase/integrase [Eggerthellaceae bacterium]
MKVKSTSVEQLDKSRPRSRCRRWRLWASTAEGRRSRRFAGTYTEACIALEAFVAELCDEAPDSDEFGPYAASWLAWRRDSGRFAPNTLQNDQRGVNALLRTHLREMKVGDISQKDCRDALAYAKSHPERASTLSNTSMAKIHEVLRAVMAQAVSDGILAANPMDGLKQPRAERVEREAFTPDELMEVVMKLGDLPMDGRVMACYLMACLGLRRGEALALAAADVDGGFCHVHQAVKERTGTIGEPKSKAGNRVLPMPEILSVKVVEWTALRAASGLGDAPTLCCNTEGGVLRPQNFQKWWDANRAAFGCEGFTSHQLRHSNLSMVARYMSPFDLQRYAGWSSLAPARIYIHDDLDAVSRAVRAAWAQNLHQSCTT